MMVVCLGFWLASFSNIEWWPHPQFKPVSAEQLEIANQAVLDYSAMLARDANQTLVWQMLGEAYIDLGNYRMAEQCLLKAIGLEEEASVGSATCLSVWLDLAELYMVENRFEAAEMAVFKVLGQQPNSMVAKLYAGYLTYHKQDFVAALRWYQDVALSDANNYAAFLGMAVSLERLGQTDHALQAYRQAATLGDDRFLARLGAAKLLDIQGDFQTATNLYTSILQENPNELVALYDLALIQQRRNRLSAAKQYYEKIIVLNDKTEVMPRVYNNLGVVERKLGNVTHAQQCFEQAMQYDQHFFDAGFNLALLLEEQNQPEKAQRLFARFWPEHAEVGPYLAEVYLQQHKLAAASAVVKQLEQTPHKDELVERLIGLQLVQHDCENALENSRYLSNPWEVLSRTTQKDLLFCLLERESSEKVLPYFLRFEANFPQDIDTKLAWIKALQQKGELSTLEKYLQQAVREQTPFVAHLLRGFYHHQLGEVEQARKFYQSAEAFDGNSLVLNEQLALLSRQMHAPAEEHYWLKALQLSHHASAVYLELGYCYLRNHRLQQAEAVLQAALQNSPETLSGKIYFYLGFVSYQQNRLSAAKRYLQNALSLDASLQEAKDVLEKIP